MPPKRAYRALPAQFVLALCWLLLSVQPAAAALLPTYDLDSLVYQSTEVVEAVLGETGEADTYPVRIATVTAVYKGPLTPGRKIAVGDLDDYATFNPVPRAASWMQTLMPGDHVFLFLVRNTGQATGEFPVSEEVHWAVLDGVKVVLKGQALGFTQLSNPGGYIADRPGPGEPTLDAFRATLTQSIRTVQGAAPLLAATPSAANAPALMDLLRERTTRPAEPGEDVLAETACTQLASLHDLSLLAQAEQIVTGPPSHEKMYHTYLDWGYDTARGRRYLLQQVADKGVPPGRRLQFAVTLYRAGASGSSEPTFTAQVVHLAAVNANDVPLCLALLDVIYDETNDISDTPAPGRLLSPLYALYRQTHSESVRSQIETITAHMGARAYAGLHPAGGPILSSVTGARRGVYDGKAALNVDYEASAPFVSETRARPELVLMRLPTRQVTVISMKAAWDPDTLQRGSQMSGSNSFALPPSLPHGTYRVFLRFRRSGSVVSVGHSCQVFL